MKIALLFEQSGHFKNAFIERGHIAHDFDIENQFDETTLQVDLFKYIDNTSMDKINEYDLVIAFYPCTYFSDLNLLVFRRQYYAFKKWSDERIDAYINERYEKQREYATRLKTMISKIKVPLIVENPRSVFIKQLLGEPTYQDNNRYNHGDYYVKPTCFYCYNGVTVTPLDDVDNKHEKLSIHHSKSHTTIYRSLISTEYVNNFINHIEFTKR